MAGMRRWEQKSYSTAELWGSPSTTEGRCGEKTIPPGEGRSRGGDFLSTSRPDQTATGVLAARRGSRVATPPASKPSLPPGRRRSGCWTPEQFDAPCSVRDWRVAAWSRSIECCVAIGSLGESRRWLSRRRRGCRWVLGRNEGGLRNQLSPKKLPRFLRGYFPPIPGILPRGWPPLPPSPPPPKIIAGVFSVTYDTALP